MPTKPYKSATVLLQFGHIFPTPERHTSFRTYNMIQSFAGFLSPNLEVYTALRSEITSSGELLLPLWLLVKGVNVEQWEKCARESA
jgi:hypothetical protein